ncbi:MAG: hypothetical protein ACOY0T_14710 [Myxococcota bacterium]
MISEDLQTPLLLLGVLLVIAIAWAAWAITRASRRRRASLRERFGPEYERAIEENGSVGRAERELLARAKRVDRLQLRTLSDAERTQYGAHWQAIQTRFVDDPSGAVRAADDLIKNVMAASGYPLENFEQRVADLSVEHANVIQHYRAARVLAEANREGRANTEELRQAFVHYRALFSDLLSPPDAAVELQEARA